jgi:hypothetical protein
MPPDRIPKLRLSFSLSHFLVMALGSSRKNRANAQEASTIKKSLESQRTKLCRNGSKSVSSPKYRRFSDISERLLDVRLRSKGDIAGLWNGRQFYPGKRTSERQKNRTVCLETGNLG